MSFTLEFVTIIVYDICDKHWICVWMKL